MNPSCRRSNIIIPETLEDVKMVFHYKKVSKKKYSPSALQKIPNTSMGAIKHT